MKSALSSELFGRISSLFHTLRHETLRLIDKVAEDEKDNTPSDNSVICIDDEETENAFVKSILEDKEEMARMKEELVEKCNIYRTDVSLEYLLNMAISLHEDTEDRVSSVCAKMAEKGIKVPQLQARLDTGTTFYEKEGQNHTFRGPKNPIIRVENIKETITQIGGGRYAKTSRSDPVDLKHLNLSEETRKLLELD